MNWNLITNIMMDNWEKRWPILLLNNNSSCKTKSNYLLEELSRTKSVQRDVLAYAECTDI